MERLLINDTLLDYRVPTDRGHAGADDRDHRRERRRARPVRGEGLRRGALAATPAAIATALADAGVPHDRASVHARAGVAADPAELRRRQRRHERDQAGGGDRHGTMGPGMGAVLARAGIDVALYDVAAPRRSSGRRSWLELARGRARPPRRRGHGDGGALRLRERPRGGARGCRVRARGDPREARARSRSCSPSARGCSPTSGDPRLEHLRASRSRRSPRSSRTPSAWSACTGRTRRT